MADDATVAARMKEVLAARFHEVVVDEAQDCNSADLAIVDWFRKIGIITKVICDPEQAIYGFRGGVGGELKTFGKSFASEHQLPMKGNFRSTENICRAIASFREPAAQANVDQALGKYKDDDTPVHIISYPGTGVPASIGARYSEIVTSLKLDLPGCPILAKTWDSAGKAVGQPIIGATSHLTLSLASAVTNFHFAFDSGTQKKALEHAHVAILDVEGHIGDHGYQHYLYSNGLEAMSWRPRALHLLRELRYDAATFTDAAAWLARARALLAPTLAVQGSTINQRLKSHADLAAALATPSATSAPALSIHSVKGKQFPGICVVMTTSSTKGILDYLDDGGSADNAEDAREIYVAASRAEQLLVFAVPKSRAAHLTKRLTDRSVAVVTHNL